MHLRARADGVSAEAEKAKGGAKGRTYSVGQVVIRFTGEIKDVVEPFAVVR